MRYKAYKFLNIIFFAICFLSCKKEIKAEINNSTSQKHLILNETDSSKIITKDSVELTLLVRKIYKWHETNFLQDFPYKYQNDTIFTGIDWEEYNKNIKLHKNTNLFTEDFFKRHKNIAKIIDNSIKEAGIEWRNINDGIPLWHSNADDWCACQDNPDEYWKILTINILKINNNIANLIWTWDKDDVKDKHEYLVTAKKINGEWKINSLQWQNHNYSVKEFDKLMND
jgi:hypothetical protein